MRTEPQDRTAAAAKAVEDAVEKLAQELHDAVCRWPWETATDEHREAWLAKARR